MMSARPFSIAVVGSGIAGLYCAHRLAARGHRVTVFEQLSHVGGRIETLNIAGIDCECGPMRFELALQPMLTALAGELGIQFSPFTPARGEPVHSTTYTLAADEMPREGTAVSLDLLKLGIYRILHCPDAKPENDSTLDETVKRPAAVPRWTFAEVIETRDAAGQNAIQQYADSLDDKDYDHIRTRATLGGRKLYTMGLWNALDYVLSAGAVSKIREVGTFYHLIPENPSASEWSIFWLRLFGTASDLSTIEGPGGVSQIVTRLLAQIRALGGSVEITPDAMVVEVGPAAQTDRVRLTIDFQEPGHVLDLEFDHVILALPRQPLSKLTRYFPSDVRRYIDGVNGFPLLKAFAILKTPWWGDTIPHAQKGAHLVPTREVHYKESPDKVGMVLFYTDRPANAYWTPYVQVPHLGAQRGGPPELRRELAAQLLALKTGKEAGPQERYKSDIDEMEASIVDFAIRDWSKPPFGAASHAWLPGINVPEAMDRLKAFNLLGQPGRGNIHVCGEAYSDYQGFIEGSLRSASKTLASIRD
jgi:phytoene dehydrogenase-like protein